MPTYEYTCSACNRGFEISQNIKDAPLTKCPTCDVVALERLLFAPLSFVKGRINTIGQLAEKNSKRAGSRLKDAEVASGAPARKAATKETNRINRMTNAQKIKYIEEG